MKNNFMRKIIGIMIYYGVYQDVCHELKKKPITLKEAIQILEEEK